jgi:hypothetical protein
MKVVICLHCGMSGETGEIPGVCSKCSPPPHVATSRAKDAQARLDEARERAQRSDRRATLVAEREAPPADPTPPGLRRERETGLTWKIRDRGWFDSVPHLYAADELTSKCGRVRHAEWLIVAPAGIRACRQCALAGGYTSSIAEEART